jgi:4-amino-4-deoxy-L-arabinose transferase-like glycosyltransferase
MMNEAQESAAVIIIMFAFLSFLILLNKETTGFQKFILMISLWIALGIAMAILYPDEFIDFILGDEV